jgi:hypothetical protein
VYRDGQLTCPVDRASGRIDTKDRLRCSVGGGEAAYDEQPFTGCEYGRARYG